MAKYLFGLCWDKKKTISKYLTFSDRGTNVSLDPEPPVPGLFSSHWGRDKSRVPAEGSLAGVHQGDRFGYILLN